MHLAVIHRSKEQSDNGGSCLYRFATLCPMFAYMAVKALKRSYWFDKSDKETVIAAPCEWRIKCPGNNGSVMRYNGNSLALSAINSRKNKKNDWSVISNAGFVTNVDYSLFNKILAGIDADLVAVSVETSLRGYQEQVLLTSDEAVAGIRRVYSNLILPMSRLANWPHHLFVRLGMLQSILDEDILPLNFSRFVRMTMNKSLKWCAFRVGGDVIDLETESGLLSFLQAYINSAAELPYFDGNNMSKFASRINSGSRISSNARLFGRIAMGNNVEVDDNAIVTGPAILGDGVKISAGAIVRNSVIGPHFSVPSNDFVGNSILVSQTKDREPFVSNSNTRRPAHDNANLFLIKERKTNTGFRVWPFFSYPRFVKRLLDVILSLTVIILCAPLFAIVALIIKLDSHGQVFFRHRRQGLQGKEFYCLKFRTMITGADEIQDKLRSKNMVDGPQFKLDNDPRTTLLRDTFIDEIPQFINILRGQMSVVGPRPSPKKENSLCPPWRDARLSVKPGITGLWQISRTRQPGRDFQEWIHFDTEYVRRISLRLDLLICWKTVQMLVSNFVRKFGMLLKSVSCNT